LYRIFLLFFSKVQYEIAKSILGINDEKYCHVRMMIFIVLQQFARLVLKSESNE